MKCITGYIMYTHWVDAQQAADLAMEELDQQGRENLLTQEQAVEEPVRAGEIEAILELLFGPAPADDPPVGAVPNTVALLCTTTRSGHEAELCQEEEGDQQA